MDPCEVLALAMRDSKRGLTGESDEEVSDVLLRKMGDIVPAQRRGPERRRPSREKGSRTIWDLLMLLSSHILIWIREGAVLFYFH